MQGVPCWIVVYAFNTVVLRQNGRNILFSIEYRLSGGHNAKRSERILREGTPSSMSIVIIAFIMGGGPQT